MSLTSSRRRWAPLLFVAALCATPSAASGALNLLPADTDAVLTVNVRQLLDDHKDTAALQRFLEAWRPLAKADETELRQFYKTKDLQKIAGVSIDDFLAQARAFHDAFGIDPLADIDRITGGFNVHDAGATVVVIEGRFEKERVKSAVRQFSERYFGSFKAMQSGDVEVWQLSAPSPQPLSPEGRGACIRLALLNDHMLVATARGKDMNDLVERADAKKSRLSPALQALLARTARQHVSLVVDHVDQLLKDAPGNLADVLTSDASCGSIAFSLGSDDLHVQLGVATAKADSARDAVRKITRGKALAGATLRALDDKRADDLGDILARARVVAKGTTVTLEADISYGTLRDLAGYIATALHPLIERATRTVLSIPIWGPEQPPAKDALEVEEVRDVAYWDDPTADPIRHRLDLFLPKGKKDYPVVVLVHGGGWVMGDNRCCGLYSSVGHFLASRGIGAVLPNYRLSPWVTHPGHVEDVARAVRWTRDHIAEHGGDPARLYLIGHSAGGHLVSLLAADEKYLTAEKMSLRDIKGVVTVSGVYRIAADPMEIFLGGSGTQSFRPDQMLPLRGDSGRLPILPPLGFSVNHDSFGSAFGSDPKARADASPLTHVHRGLPPFLILTAESDLPTVSGMAEEFHKALKDAGCEARLLKVEKRNHSSLMFSAIRPDDTAARAILEFVR